MYVCYKLYLAFYIQVCFHYYTTAVTILIKVIALLLEETLLHAICKLWSNESTVVWFNSLSFSIHIHRLGGFLSGA